MTAPATRPVAMGLWADTADGPRLVGGRCAACQTTTYPRQAACPRCTAVDSHDVLLPGYGMLWTFTVQAFPPKPPYLAPAGAEFVPYGVGYVELGDVIVETRLTVSDPEQLHIDMAMRLVIVPFARDDEGTEVLTFAFAPVGGAR